MATAAAQPVFSQEQLDTWFKKSWYPSERQESYEITEIEGEIPKDLHGTLYRNGPSQRIMPPTGYESLHLFDGDALVHGFRFDDGKAHYTGRFVESESYLIEQEAGEMVLGTVNVRIDDPTDKVFLREQHNTNIVHHGGKLMALVENSWPFQLDERTLESIGKTDFGVEQLGMSVTAHPKIDPQTGDWHSFSTNLQSGEISYSVLSQGQLRFYQKIADAKPALAFVHDGFLTPNYAIFPDLSLRFDPGQLFKEHASAFYYDPDYGMRFGVVSRDAGESADVRWFDAGMHGHIWHTVNGCSPTPIRAGTGKAPRAFCNAWRLRAWAGSRSRCLCLHRRRTGRLWPHRHRYRWRAERTSPGRETSTR